MVNVSNMRVHGEVSLVTESAVPWWCGINTLKLVVYDAGQRERADEKLEN